MVLTPAGCREAPREPNTLRLAAVGDFRSFDPAVVYDAWNIAILRLICQTLFDYDDRGETIVPLLAESLPDISADLKTYTIKVRQGIFYSTGRKLSADDFVYAWNRIMTIRPASPWASYLKSVVGVADVLAGKASTAEGLEVLDRHTLRVRLTHPDHTLLNTLCMPFTTPLPREEVEAAGEEFHCRPIGTGPYALREWRRNVRARLERNPHQVAGTRPAIDAVEITLGLDRLTSLLMFERGEIDLLLSIPTTDYVHLKSQQRWQEQIASLTLNETNYLIMNCEVPPFTDRRIRQAVACAVDRERLVQAQHGRATAARGVLPPGLPGYNPRLAGQVYDPDRARRLLAEAGHAQGLELTLWYTPEVPNYNRVGEIVQQNLADVGVAVKLHPVSYPVFLSHVGKRGEVAFCLTGWFQDYPDPKTFLDTLFAGSQIAPLESTNMSFFDDLAVNGLLDRAVNEPDRARRNALYQQVEERIVEEAPAAFLYHRVETSVAQPWVRGNRLDPVFILRYDRLALTR
jgi:ABC-type transport system substrate-binding protein